MALTVNSIITNLNSYIGDSSTDRITAAERLQYVTEATIWLQEELGNDLQNATYPLHYYDTVHTYKITTATADMLMGSDLRRGELDQVESFTHKSSRELAEEIGQRDPEPSWTIERRDGDSFLVVNAPSKYAAITISDCDSTTSGGGTWELDAVNSDATNLTIDVNEFKQGSASFNFDADVSQSGNNKLELVNTDLSTLDLSDYEDLAAFIFWVYIPDTTDFTSVTLYWGSSTSNYWSATTTTDITGSAWVNGWNRVKFNWSDATATGTPDETAITYMQVDLNYGAGQGDDTDFRIDDIILVRPEKLTFHYLSWNVGTTSGGTDLTAFAATSDIPYFSGQYDQYKYAVAHKAASIAFQNLRLLQESQFEQAEAERALSRARQFIPSSKNPETKSFKVRGNNLTRHKGRR